MAAMRLPLLLLLGVVTATHSLNVPEGDTWETVFVSTTCFWESRLALRRSFAVIGTRLGYFGSDAEFPSGLSPGATEVVEVAYRPGMLKAVILTLQATLGPAQQGYLYANATAAVNQSLTDAAVPRVRLLPPQKFTPAVAPSMRCPGQDRDHPEADGEISAAHAVDFRKLVARMWKAGGTAILVYVTENFRLYLVNWLIFAQHAGIDENMVAVICVDSRIGPWLKRFKHRGCDMTFAGGWAQGERERQAMPTVRRLPVTRALLDAGLHVLMCDTDAIFRSNPVPFLRSITSGVDIVASTGHYPEATDEQFSGSPCMGFIWYRPTPHARRFLMSVYTLSPKKTMFLGAKLALRAIDSDQLRTASALRDEGWRVEPINRGTGPRGLRMGVTQTGTRISMIPEELVVRLCDRLDKPPEASLVLHCWSPATVRETKLRKKWPGHLYVVRTSMETQAQPMAAWRSFLFEATVPWTRRWLWNQTK